MWKQRKPEESKDTIKHGEKIVFNGRTSHAIDLSEELNPIEGFKLFEVDTGVMILDVETLKPVDVYPDMSSLNNDYESGENNVIERVL